MNAIDFVDAENWQGGFYELAIELGPYSDARLQIALARVWADARLEGCYGERNRQPGDQPRVEPTVAALDTSGHLRGLATLPNGARAVCGTVAARGLDDRHDWLDVYLPLGSLARADERVGAYPFGAAMTIGDETPSRDSLMWRQPLDAWLAEIAASIFQVVPFRLGLIGFETSGATTADELTRLPEERYITYLLPEGNDLVVCPATI